jgi:hypothetical protein
MGEDSRKDHYDENLVINWDSNHHIKIASRRITIPIPA